MGLTIHYKGRLNQPDLILQVRKELEDISRDMEWDFTTMDNDLEKPNNAYIEKGIIKGHLPFKGIIINIHPRCEPLMVLFDKEGILSHIIPVRKDEELSDEPILSVKTQFAPLEVHISIVRLLRYLKNKYIGNLTVIDEGEYWDTGDKNILEQKLEFLNKKMSQIEEALESLPRDINDTAESLLNKLEAALKKMTDRRGIDDN
jgi:hypothetical protein